MIRCDCTSAPQKATQLTLHKGPHNHSSLNFIPKMLRLHTKLVKRRPWHISPTALPYANGFHESLRGAKGESNMAIVKKAAAILTAASMLVAPVAASAASANEAQSLSVVRANAPASAESNFGGKSTAGTILLVAVVAGMIYAAYELIDGDDHPTSV